MTVIANQTEITNLIHLESTSGSVALPYLDVWGSRVDPESVTDWGAIINAFIDSGVKTFYFSDHDFPCTTPINAANTTGVTFTGANGLIWRNDFPQANATSRLRYTGSNTARFINAKETNAFALVNLGVYIDTNNFTGDIVDIGGTSGVSGGAMISGCHIGVFNATFTGATLARSAVLLDRSVCPTIKNSSIGDAQWGLLGTTTFGCFAPRFNNIRFYHCGRAFIGNIGNQWTIDQCVFEVHETPAVIDSDLSIADVPITSDFRLSNWWAGDQDVGHSTPFFIQRPDNIWRCGVIDGQNYLSVNTGPAFDLRGSGQISISGVGCNINDNTEIIDLGDVVGLGAWNSGTSYTTGNIVTYSFGSSWKALRNNLNKQPNTNPLDWELYARPKSSVTIHDNFFNTSEANAVQHQTGHFGVSIKRNGALPSIESETLVGHRYAGYSQNATLGNVPTIAVHSGVTLGGQAIYGTDSDGWIRINIPAEGVASAVALVDITFGTPYLKSPGWLGGDPNAQIVAVTLTPVAIGAIWGGGAGTVGQKSAQSQPFVMNPTQTGFSIGLGDADAAFGTSVTLVYSVTGL